MSGPYFQHPNWPSFFHNDVEYDLSHLHVTTIQAVDTDGVARSIAVSYSDHCFTTDPKGDDDPALRYLASTRPVGYFNFERYQLSLNLGSYLAQAVAGKVWIIEGENFAAVPVVNNQGDKMLYGIVFSLDRVKKMPVDINMRVRSAYPCDEKAIVTHGNVRFAHLLALRMQGKQPKRNFDKHRPRPRLS